MLNDVTFRNLKVDKENGIVQYNDELHKYWVKETDSQCISVTTLIHKFTTFDEAFWSAYKTLESLISEEDFKAIKSDLTLTKKFSDSYLEKFEIDKEVFEGHRKTLLVEWARKREESCVRGSAIHLEQELRHLDGNTKELQKLGLGGKFETNTTNELVLGAKGVYPELLLSRVSEDGVLKIAGQADLVIIDNNDVYVLDYKTNKKIDKNAFFDSRTKKKSMMKYPLNNIQDTNFWHYSLQLSTYAWMIEKYNPAFNIKSLILIHYDHDGGVTEYECEYLKKDVERMLRFYKKQIIDDEFKRSREKIIF